MKTKKNLLPILTSLVTLGLAGCGTPSHTHDFSHLIDKVDATCTESGVEAHYLCNCGKYFDEHEDEVEFAQLEIAPKGHSYVGRDYEKTLTSHTIQCNRCTYSLTTNHTFKDYAKVDATCVNAGREAYHECKECRILVNEDKTSIVTSLADLTINALGHNKTSLISRKEPTCTEIGVEAHYGCTRCEQLFDTENNEVTLKDLEIDALGHDYTGSETHFDLTKHWVTCKRSGCEYHNESTHRFVEHNEVSPTCTLKGTKAHYTCQDCDVIVNILKTSILSSDDLVLNELGHDNSSTEWHSDATSHWKVCARSGCDTVLDKGDHDGTGFTNVVDTTLTKAGSFELDCTVCHQKHEHNYKQEATFEFHQDNLHADVDFECLGCDTTAPGHIFTTTVETSKEEIEKGRITPGGNKYSASVTFLGNTYTDYVEVMDDEYGWIPASTGSDVAEIYRNEVTGNIVLNAKHENDTNFFLDEAYVEKTNKVNATMMQITLKILSADEGASIWFKGPNEQVFGDMEHVIAGNTIQLYALVDSQIQFIKKIEAEVVDLYYVDPFLKVNEVTTQLALFGTYHSERNEEGLLSSVTIKEDGVNDFDAKAGLSNDFFKEVLAKGYTYVKINLSKDKGKLFRYRVNGGEVEYSDKDETIIRIDVNENSTFLIDVCTEVGAVIDATISMNKFTYGNELIKLSDKVVSSESNFWSYIHVDFWGDATNNPFGASKWGEYVVGKGCLYVQPNTLFSEAQELGATTATFELEVANDVSDTRTPKQVVLIHQGGAFITESNVLIKDGKATITVDLTSYLFNIEDSLKLGVFLRVSDSEEIYEGASAPFENSGNILRNVWFKVNQVTFSK